MTANGGKCNNERMSDDLKYIYEPYIKIFTHHIEQQLFHLRFNRYLYLLIIVVLIAFSYNYTTIILSGLTVEKLGDSFVNHFFIIRTSLILFLVWPIVYFFKIYKSNEGEIKYFVNEKTVLISKITVFISSQNNDDPTLQLMINLLLAETERNVKLKSGESTEGIETEKLNNESGEKFLEVLTKMFNHGKK